MVSVLNRVTTIIRANINDILERAEDPEVMLNQILRDMYDGIKEAREQVVDAMAQQKLQERDLAQAKELSTKWRRHAEMALAQGDENLARECLRRKRDYDNNAQAMQSLMEAQRPVVERLRGELALLESKYADLQRNRDALLARYRLAKAQERVQAAGEQMTASISVYDPAEQLVAMERRIRTSEARVAAREELATGGVAALEQGGDPEIEAELLQLKAAADQPQLSTGDEG
ncbi:MAG: PspA/IM30 family protein [Anaerolineae bacterium]